MNGRKGPRLLEHVLWDAAFRSARSEVTLNNYRVALRRWARAGVVKVDDVAPESAQRFVEGRLARGVQVQTVAVEFAAVMSLLDHEAIGGRFKPDLLQRIRRCAPSRPRKKELCAPFLSADQVEAFCVASDERTAFLVRLACYTGLRASDLAALDWSDVDLGRRSLRVRKGKTGPRKVSLCAPAVDLLRPRLASGRVFGDVTARTLQEWVRGARASQAVKARREGCKVRVTLTLCRHTRASWWIQAGVPVAIVARQLGHSVAVCLAYYGGLSDDYDPILERGAAG
ncbi:MAG: site-specific integrase [Planctomycetota bacterium]|nr:site-specific integrase [Planctomycetota bacterium]